MGEWPPMARNGRRESIDLPPFMAFCEEPYMCENLQCPVCLDVFTDPITTPCGHNFCRTCLNACWDHSQDYACPYCKKKSIQRPDLKFNFVIKAIVELIKNNTKGLSSADGPLSEELQCAICLDVFNNPVTTPCGHNFCKSCLKQCWENSQDCTCPVCKHTFSERPDLKSNTGLREIVRVFEETSGYKRETEIVEYSPALKREDQEETLVKPSAMASSSSILTEDQCDICLDVFTNPVTAPCEHNFWKISQDYDCPDSKENVSERSDLRELKSESEIYQSSATEQRERILDIKQVRMIELVGNINPNICLKHERNLGLFFRDYQTSAHLFCTEEDHRTHNTPPVDEESAEVKTQLVKSHSDVQRLIQGTMNKVKEIKHLVKMSKKITEKEESTELCTHLNHSVEMPLSEITSWIFYHLQREISLY